MHQIPAPPRRRNVRLWPWLAGIGALLFIAGAFVFAFWVTSDNNAGTNAGGGTVESGSMFDVSNSETQLRQAFSSCHSGDLADQDHTLVIDTAGDDYESGADSFDGLACTLGKLGTPTSVTAQMDSTRALDGMQSADWGDFSASWTYHPDAGIDLIITENS
jgi:hypothetical protein